MVLDCQAPSVMTDEPSARLKMLQSSPVSAKRWEIAELTADEIGQLEPAQMWDIVAATSPAGWMDMARSNDQPGLRRLVWQARRTCRRQGY